MRIESVRLTNFRCFEDRTFPLPGLHTVITGPNAAGKTSLLEAVSLVTRGRSFRTSDDRDLVRKGADGFFVRTECVSAGIAHVWEAARTRIGRRVWRQDGRGATLKEIFPLAPCVALYTEDLGLVTGATGLRRALLNEILCRTDPVYREAYLDGHRVLRERNAELKKKTRETRESSTRSTSRPRGMRSRWPNDARGSWNGSVRCSRRQSDRSAA
jgi:DNA replication and repair protein RecF